MTDIQKRAARAIGLLSAALALVLFVGLVWRPPCPILHFTGFYCAGCGFCRMLEAALHGDFAVAFRLNPFLFAASPLAVLYAAAEAVQYIRKKRPLYRSRLSIPIAVVVIVASVVFMILRNLH